MSRRAARWLASGAIALFALLAAASGLDRLTEQQPGMARRAPTILRSQTILVETAQSLGAGDYAGAERSAADALSASPLDRRSAAFLGAARAMQGEAEGAAAAFAVANRLGRREPLTQAYLFGRAVEAGDAGAAAAQIDSLLRTHPGFAAIQGYLRQLESMPEGRAELLRRVARERHWAAAYLDGYAVDQATLRQRATTIAGAQAPGIGCAVVTPFLRNLEDRNLHTEASRVREARCRSRD